MDTTVNSQGRVPVIEAQHVKMYFTTGSRFSKKRKTFRAVDDVSLEINEGETVGLVGESGCGKTTLGRVILDLYHPTSGRILYAGRPIDEADKKELRMLRRNIQMVFQDPYASLNPRRTIFESVRAPLESYHIGNEAEQYAKTAKTLEEVGIDASSFHKYPHELSGGQRQRVAIARAVILDPQVIVCDEPVSALDVSIRAQVLNLLKRIQQEKHVSYLFISHDLSVVRYLCDKVAVMYLGKIVEYGTTREIFTHPEHPYTKALLSAIPVPDVDRRMNRIILEGEVPSPADPPSGCRFRTRCPYASERCGVEEPQLTGKEGSHRTACFLENGGTLESEISVR